MNAADRIEYRMLAPGERMQAFALCRESFPEDGESFARWYFARKFKYDQAAGAFDPEGLKSFMLWADADIALRGRMFFAPVVAYVCTAQGYRGRGISRGLTRFALRALRESGCALCTLYPFNYGFYRRMGWEDCYSLLRYELAPPALAAAPDGSVRDADVYLERDALAQAYARASARYEGIAVRGSARWLERAEEAALDGRRACVCYRAGRPAGYAIYGIEADGSVAADEVLALDARDFEQLIAHLAQRAAGRALRFNLPLDRRLFHLSADVRGMISLEPGSMGRVVDVLGLSGAWAGGDGEVTLAVVDPMAPWNEGVFRFCASGGELSVERTESAPQARIDIGALAQLVWGARRAADLAARGGLAAAQGARLEAIDAIFPRLDGFLFERYG